MTVEFFPTTKIDDSCTQVSIMQKQLRMYGNIFFINFFHELCTLQA